MFISEHQFIHLLARIQKSEHVIIIGISTLFVINLLYQESHVDCWTFSSIFYLLFFFSFIFFIYCYEFSLFVMLNQHRLHNPSEILQFFFHRCIIFHFTSKHSGTIRRIIILNKFSFDETKLNRPLSRFVQSSVRKSRVTISHANELWFLLKTHSKTFIYSRHI